MSWELADILNALMALPNLISLFLLSGEVSRLTREYFARTEKL
jgi:AGCS family alanine or glycine:cation symporter